MRRLLPRMVVPMALQVQAQAGQRVVPTGPRASWEGPAYPISADDEAWNLADFYAGNDGFRCLNDARAGR